MLTVALLTRRVRRLVSAWRSGGARLILLPAATVCQEGSPCCEDRWARAVVDAAATLPPGREEAVQSHGGQPTGSRPYTCREAWTVGGGGSSLARASASRGP